MVQQGENVELGAEERTVLGKQVKHLRREGFVPGVLYGRGFDSVALQFEEKALAGVLSQVGGSQLIAVNVQGKKKPEMALIREVHRDVIRGNVLHIDLYRVLMTEKITTEVPLMVVGVSPVTEMNEGILLHGVSSIEVQCLPGDLVDTIEVDLTSLLEVDAAILVRDLAVPAGIEVLTDPDETVARVAPLAAEEELPVVVEEEEALLAEGEEAEALAEGEEEAATEDAEAE
ncbi:MAG: 50S ribosomal protein L25 [Anaerolineales bacterium]|nr:MAG: 50S ribosomal protein L25 [Anaerolineales bacterium]